MKIVWTQDSKDPEEKAKLEKSIRHHKWVLDRLWMILKGMERGLDRSRISPKHYDSRNWEYRQAHSNGYQQCLLEIQDLINLDQEVKNDPRKPTE